VARPRAITMAGHKPEDADTASAPPPETAGTAKAPYLIVIAGAHVGELHKLNRPRTIIGRGETAQIRITDDGISREHTEIAVEGDHVVIRDLGSTNGTYCNGARVEALEIVDGDKILVGSTTILKFSYQDGIEEAYQRELYRSAARDPATRALKKEFFLERLEGEVAFALRHASPLALVMWDLDRFKAVNDQHGHPAGDRVLVASARAVSEVIRREDILARYGGEEFALACRATNMARAFRLAERLREAIGAATVEAGTAVIQVTASFGVAVCPNPGVSNAADLIAAADAAMYRAKTHGRDRTEIAP
jgi:two-component system cell cycle response regulator